MSKFVLNYLTASTLGDFATGVALGVGMAVSYILGYQEVHIAWNLAVVAVTAFAMVSIENLKN